VRAARQSFDAFASRNNLAERRTYSLCLAIAKGVGIIREGSVCVRTGWNYPAVQVEGKEDTYRGLDANQLNERDQSGDLDHGPRRVSAEKGKRRYANGERAGWEWPNEIARAGLASPGIEGGEFGGGPGLGYEKYGGDGSRLQTKKTYSMEGQAGNNEEE
jgi:hypothetical protein